MNRTLIALTALLLAPSALAVKVGALIPLSGAGSVSGQAAKNGYQLALDEINASGGVLGKPLELIIEDDQSNPAKAVPAFVKLQTVDRVDFTVGGVSSATSVALSGPAKQYNAFMAWIGGAAVPVEDAFADHKYFFHYHPWSYYNFEAILDLFKYLKAKGAKNIALAYEDGPFGSAGVADTVAAFKKAGFNVVLQEKFKTGSGNFAPLINKAKGYDVDLFYWVGYDVDALPLASAIKEANFKPGLIYGTPPSWPVGFENNRLSSGIAGLSLWLPESPTKASRDFVAKYKKKFGKVTDEYFAPLAYTNLITLAAAINAAGSTDKDKVAAALAKTKASTPFGTLTFTSSNKIKYQGFKAGQWLHFQFMDGKRIPVFPIDYARKPVQYPQK
ncbi:branched-chain amino acid transport system substrate-binding protein [Deinobacterium chartae]|uniref:Branched-chain amino acid transport system substrate-binding protein n=1 Tax=Deinobacterium chartae TaxID=521158 RepID=A0A841I1I9_9DEIO|nr:amino acid ABC transporter substrate-binding protein [Deinobacterium chartae]MBB6098854.1 branched-chain amino acid transport system substrate-binding protein [Deinobacterium chartae]